MLLEAPGPSGYIIHGEFDSVAAAQQAVSDYYERWPSMAYGTSLVFNASRDGKTVEVTGRRAASAD